MHGPPPATRPRVPRRARGAIAAVRRYCRYHLIVPVVRSPHPPEYTARGVANGVFWGLTPSVGLQTIEIVVTWIVGQRVFKRDSSLLQAFIWVWVNNPLTMIPLYYAFYVTGLWLMGYGGRAAGYDAFVAIFQDAGDSSWIERSLNAARAIGIPAFIGCIPYAAIGSALSYRWAMKVIRARHARRLRAKVAERNIWPPGE